MLDYSIIKLIQYFRGRDNQQRQSGPKPSIKGSQPPTGGSKPEITVAPLLHFHFSHCRWFFLRPVINVLQVYRNRSKDLFWLFWPKSAHLFTRSCTFNETELSVLHRQPQQRFKDNVLCGLIERFFTLNHVMLLSLLWMVVFTGNKAAWIMAKYNDWLLDWLIDVHSGNGTVPH